MTKDITDKCILFLAITIVSPAFQDVANAVAALKPPALSTDLVTARRIPDRGLVADPVLPELLAAVGLTNPVPPPQDPDGSGPTDPEPPVPPGLLA